MASKTPTGITRRHGRACKREGRCNCPWQASVWSAKEGKKIREEFPTQAAAVGWRADAQTQLRKGTMRAPTQTTIALAWVQWVKDAQAGVIRARGGDPYKPAAIRTYSQSMRLRVLDELGSYRLSALDRVMLQDYVDRLVAAEWSPSTVQGALLPLRALYVRAMERGEVAVNPTSGLRMPRIPKGRDRVAPPEEAARLIAALPQADQPLWATAMYAGLRRGELQALRWEDVDLERGVIDVRRSWDYFEGEQLPKSRSGRRTVPVPGVLRAFLLRHRMVSMGEGLVFPREPGGTVPFAPTATDKRAKAAWKRGNDAVRAEAEEEGVEVDPARLLNAITPHEARHTYASLMIQAGVNAKALSTYMGHSSISFTWDRYGHLMPGNEAEAGDLLDAYLSRGTEAS